MEHPHAPRELPLPLRKRSKDALHEWASHHRAPSPGARRQARPELRAAFGIDAAESEVPDGAAMLYAPVYKETRADGTPRGGNQIGPTAYGDVPSPVLPSPRSQRDMPALSPLATAQRDVPVPASGGPGGVAASPAVERARRAAARRGAPSAAGGACADSTTRDRVDSAIDPRCAV